MEASELRIGNIVETSGMIVNIEGSGIEDFANGCLNLQPIPLTEEWLLKLGFNKDYKKGYIGIDVHNSDFVLTEPFVIGEWQSYYTFQFTAGNIPKFTKLEFLHQLQNLYFALTGEELNIKD